MIKLDTAITAYLEASYQKIRLLKDTAKSQVWLATDRTGQTVVLKRLASTGLPLKALQEADCPLCPKILCYAEDKDSTLLVEEHIAGDSLQHLASRGKLTEKEATDLLLTVASGLALLHAHGIVHRDNDSNTALPPSTVTFAYANNYGKKLNTETILPALSPGETTDIPIPCGTAFPEGTEGLAIWVQIRLPKTILPQTENYQCLRLDVAQTK